MPHGFGREPQEQPRTMGHGLWRLQSLPWALQLCLEGHHRVFHECCAVPDWLRPAAPMAVAPPVVAKLLFNAVATEDLPATLDVLSVCAAHVDGHVDRLTRRAAHVLQQAGWRTAEQQRTTELAVEAALLAHGTLHQALGCVQALVREAQASSQLFRRARTGLTAEADLLKLYARAARGIGRWFDPQQQQPPPHEGNSWRMALRACLVHVHMLNALVLAEVDGSHALRALHPRLPLLSHARLLAGELACQECCVARSVLRDLVRAMRGWSAEVPDEVLAAARGPASYLTCTWPEPPGTTGAGCRGR